MKYAQTIWVINNSLIAGQRSNETDESLMHLWWMLHWWCLFGYTTLAMHLRRCSAMNIVMNKAMNIAMNLRRSTSEHTEHPNAGVINLFCSFHPIHFGRRVPSTQNAYTFAQDLAWGPLGAQLIAACLGEAFLTNGRRVHRQSTASPPPVGTGAHTAC